MTNKTFQKSISVIIIILMLLNVPVLAESSSVLTVGSVTVDKGQTAQVIVQMENPQGMKTIQFSIEYDKTYLSVTEENIVLGSELAGWTKEINVKSDAGEIALACISNSPIAAARAITVCSFQFEVSSDAPYGELPIVITSIVAGDKDNQKIKTSSKNGVIKVAQSGSIDPSPSPSSSPTPSPESTKKPSTGGVISVTQPSATPTVQPGLKTEFQDLKGYDWAAESITTLAEKGIIKGTSDTTFEPENNIIRADYIILMVRLLGIEAEVTSNFDDVSPDQYYYKAVGAAKALGMTTGVGDNKFDPEAPISRQDMFAITYRMLKMQNILPDGIQGGNLEDFSDYSSISDYATEGISILVAMNMVQGNDHAVLPMNNATRAETAVFVMRIYNFINNIK